jgi:mono/diheme cytochrome c family protein
VLPLLAATPPGLSAQPAGPLAAPPEVGPPRGTPRGWQLSWPPGSAARGRAAFERFECFACHEVRGEAFPAATNQAAAGPELSAMGPLHDAPYFLEALVNPSATIERGLDYEAADGSSKMPSYNDSMTVQELIDLVSYLRSLRPPPGTPPARHRH